MKNKIQLIDVTIISSYMGRWLTLLSTVLVIGIAVSAWLERGHLRHNIISVCVADAVAPGDATEALEPFRVLLARETRRPVVLTVAPAGGQAGGAAAPEGGHDMYIMPTAEYVATGEQLGLEALFEILDTERLNDQAVIIARSGDHVDLASLGEADIAFAAPQSVNRFWVQASILEKHGAKRLVDPRFEGGDFDAARVILAVVFGQYRAGACRLSDIAALRQRGILRGGEVSVLDKADVLPEIVVAVPHGEASYYRRRLDGVAARIAEAASPSMTNETVQLLKSCGFKGLQPVDAMRVERARKLARRYAGEAASAAP